MNRFKDLLSGLEYVVWCVTALAMAGVCIGVGLGVGGTGGPSWEGWIVRIVISLVGLYWAMFLVIKGRERFRKG